MRKFLPLFLTFTFISFFAYSQDFPFGQVDNDALNMKKYDKDTSAHAVVVNEYGTSRIAFDNEYRIKITFMRHIKIKFFDSKDFESKGTFEVPIYTWSEQSY